MNDLEDSFEVATRRIRKVYNAMPSQIKVLRYSLEGIHRVIGTHMFAGAEKEQITRKAAKFMDIHGGWAAINLPIHRGAKPIFDRYQLVTVHTYFTEKTTPFQARFILGHEIGHLMHFLYVGNYHNGVNHGAGWSAFPGAMINSNYMHEMATDKEEIADAFGWVAECVDRIMATGKMLTAPKEENFNISMVAEEIGMMRTAA